VNITLIVIEFFYQSVCQGMLHIIFFITAFIDFNVA